MEWFNWWAGLEQWWQTKPLAEQNGILGTIITVVFVSYFVGDATGFWASTARAMRRLRRTLRVRWILWRGERALARRRRLASRTASRDAPLFWRIVLRYVHVTPEAMAYILSTYEQDQAVLTGGEVRGEVSVVTSPTSPVNFTAHGEATSPPEVTIMEQAQSPSDVKGFPPADPIQVAAEQAVALVTSGTCKTLAAAIQRLGIGKSGTADSRYQKVMAAALQLQAPRLVATPVAGRLVRADLFPEPPRPRPQ